MGAPSLTQLKGRCRPTTIDWAATSLPRPFCSFRSWCSLPSAAVSLVGSSLPTGTGVHFFEIELLLILGLWLYESLAQLLAVSMHPALATMGVTCFWLVAFLFGGALIDREDVPWPFRVFAYIAPYRYMAAAATHSEFSRITFDGAERQPDGSFSCPSIKGMIGCYGITGEEVLESLSNVIYNLTPDNEYWQNVGIVAGIAVLFKVLFIIVAYFKVTKAVVINNPEETLSPHTPTDTYLV